MSREQIPFHRMPDPHRAVTAGAVLGRLVESVGFRFRWATEGMRDADLPYKPAPDCMTHAELLFHIHDLLVSAGRTAGLPPEPELPEPAPSDLLRARVLDLCVRLSGKLTSMSENELSGCTPRLWNMINGPVADCLTHIGQVLSWRRLAGAPPAAADYFRGLPPPGA